MIMSAKALSNVTILDLTWVYSGPYCASLLMDLGAEVIKIEAPPYGDHTRTFPPFKNGHSGYFYQLNRGKKSIALNLKTEDGKKIFFDLVKKADVVIENFVPGAMDKLGIGYDVLKELNPRIIYGSIHGFGTWGDYSGWPAVDPVAQAMGGLMSLSGFPGGPPIKTGPAIADAISGLYLALGLVSALYELKATGKGKRIEVGMMDAVFACLEESVIRASMTGDALPSRGNTDPLGAPWDAFHTKDDKWVMVCAIGGDNCEKLFNAIGRTDLAEQYKGNDEESSNRRSDNLAFLNNSFAEWAVTKDSEELMEFFHDLKMPCGVVKDVYELLSDPHLNARNMVVDIKHPKLGDVKTFNNPIVFDKKSVGISPSENQLDPELGQHSKEILKKMLNLSDEAIEALYSSKAVWK